MVDHEQIQEQIPAFLGSRLDAQESGRVEEHLTDCEDCADLVRVGSELVHGMKDGKEEVFAPHPDVRMLRRYSLGEEIDGRTDLVRHMASCASCELEVSGWRRWGKVMPTSTQEEEFREAQGRRINWKPALAAGILLGIGLTLGLRGLSSQPEEIPALTAPWTGSAALLTLEAPLRGAAPAAQIFVQTQQPYLPLVVSPEIPESALSGNLFHFAIADVNAGTTVWSLELTAEDLRTQIRTSGVVTFLVPTGSMAAGLHDFSMQDDGGASLLQIPFEVQRQSPVATNPPQ
jgi:hypothetical protein